MKRRDHIDELHFKARKAIKKAVAKALIAHAKAGVPAMIWKDGKVVALKPKTRKK